MGMYTELVIKAHMLPDMPQDVKFILNFLFNDSMDMDDWDGKIHVLSNMKLPSHPFFSTPLWTSIGRRNSMYHIPRSLSFFDGNYLFSRFDLIDEGEIDNFLDWIRPYVGGGKDECIGWKWNEKDLQPTLIFGRDE